MKILIIRMSALGDIIMASGILPAIKRVLPKSNITWLSQKEYVNILKNSPYIDKVISFDRKGFSKSFKKGNFFELLKLLSGNIKNIRSDYYDIVIDLQGIWKSAIWAKLAKADKKIVVDPKEGSSFLYSEKVLSDPKDKKIGAEYRLVLKKLGISDSEYSFGLGKFLDPLNLKENYIVFCPFTTREQKFWIDRYWRELKEKIEQLGFKIVVLGGPQDTLKFRDIFGDNASVINLVGKLNILESLGVIMNSSGIIGVDTGLTHCGMLLKKPTVAIFGSTCPYLNTGYSKGIVLYKKLSCSPCKRRPMCKGEYSCMKYITPHEVLDHFVKIC